MVPSYSHKSLSPAEIDKLAAKADQAEAGPHDRYREAEEGEEDADDADDEAGKHHPRDALATIRVVVAADTSTVHPPVLGPPTGGGAAALMGGT